MHMSDVTILNVDDHEPGRYAITRILRNAGFHVREASTGRETLQLALERPDLIILDVNLPDMSGMEVCRKLKADPNTNFIPVLHISSTYMLSENKAQGLESGADSYLTGPVDPLELIATVKALLRVRRAEAKARALARQWQTTFDAIGDGVLLRDLEGVVLQCNQAAANLLGQSPGEIIGRSLRDLGWAAALGRVEGSPFARMRETHRREVMEWPFRERWFRVTVDPVFDDAGALTGAICILSDITERKRAEEERNQFLRREQKAREEAEAANRAKDEFLAMVSHELRTPLTAMLGWARLLRTGTLDSAAQGHGLETIERNARVQAQLVNDLLDASRIITGKLRLDVQPVELVAVIEAAIDAVRPAAQAKAIRLTTMLDPQAGSVSGDPDRLQQVVWNLLSNAIKFTPKSGRVEVRLDRSASQAQITVADTGQGIDPGFLPYVFDRFRQADSTSQRTHSGLGLGLAIVRHLVELHGGTVQADSAGEGQGATFTVRIPLRAVRPETKDNLRLLTFENRAWAEAQPALHGVRVLVVDDEADARELIARMLEQSGADVTTAASAAEALEIVRQSPPDVLISDIGMPSKDGYELMRKIRALAPEQGGRIPAVALTAYARTEDRLRALASGFQTHVAKPVEAIELAMVVAGLVGHSGR